MIYWPYEPGIVQTMKHFRQSAFDAAEFLKRLYDLNEAWPVLCWACNGIGRVRFSDAEYHAANTLHKVRRKTGFIPSECEFFVDGSVDYLCGTCKGHGTIIV